MGWGGTGKTMWWVLGYRKSKALDRSYEMDRLICGNVRCSVPSLVLYLFRDLSTHCVRPNHGYFMEFTVYQGRWTLNKSFPN